MAKHAKDNHTPGRFNWPQSANRRIRRPQTVQRKSGRPSNAVRSDPFPNPLSNIFYSFCEYDTQIGIDHGFYFNTVEIRRINSKQKSVIFAYDQKIPIDSAKETINQQIKEMLDDPHGHGMALMVQMLQKDTITNIILSFVRLYPKECLRQIAHTMAFAINYFDNYPDEQRLNEQYGKLNYLNRKIFPKVRIKNRIKNGTTDKIKESYKDLVGNLQKEFRRFADSPNQIREKIKQHFKLRQEQKQWAENMERQLSEQIERERQRRRSAAETDQLPQAE